MPPARPTRISFGAMRTRLDGLRAGQSLREIERAVLACRARGAFEPDLAMLELIIAALDSAGSNGTHQSTPVTGGGATWPSAIARGTPTGTG